MGNIYGESIKIMKKLLEKSVYEKAILSSEEAGIKFIDLVSRLMTKRAARFAIEKYCVQSNNRNVKTTTTKTFAKIKIKGSPKGIRKEDGALGVRRTSARTTSNINEISNKFSRKIRRGKVHNANKLLTNNMENGILPLKKRTLQQTKKSIHQDAILIQNHYYQTN